ncbi:IS1 family transposase [Serratia odorifera]|uniref:IS1 family transposase n=1 Tax=Serratia odorifera TaxID=618 RepID=UPI0039FBB24A
MCRWSAKKTSRYHQRKQPGSLSWWFWHKAHLATDGKGLPLHIMLSCGRTHESQFAQCLLVGIGVQRQNGSMKRRGLILLADKAYSGHALRYNLTLHTRIKGLARKTICISRTVDLHEKIMGVFIERFIFY